jgi:hypothetical protein
VNAFAKFAKHRNRQLRQPLGERDDLRLDSLKQAGQFLPFFAALCRNSRLNHDGCRNQYTLGLFKCQFNRTYILLRVLFAKSNSQ